MSNTQNFTSPIIHLNPISWRAAAWRKLEPLPHPQPPPFDQQALCKRIDSAKTRWIWKFPWQKMNLSPGMSRIEAHFWLKVMVHMAQGNGKPSPIADIRSLKAVLDGNPPHDEIAEALATWSRFHFNGSLIIPFATLLPPAELVGQVISQFGNLCTKDLVRGIQEYVLPYLTDEERAQVRERIGYQVDGAILASTRHQIAPLVLYIAAALGGFEAELETKIAPLPDNLFKPVSLDTFYRYNYLGAVEIIYGLADPEKVEYHTRRLGHLLWHVHQADGWLAHTETRALDWLHKSILNSTRDTALDLFRGLAAVENEAVVPIMLDLQHYGPVAPQAMAWLRGEHADLSIRGAVKLWVKEDNTEVREFLRGFKRRGEDASLKALSLEPVVQARFEAEILNFVENNPPPFDATTSPNWLMKLVESAPSLKRQPNWLDITELPPLVADGHSLNSEQITALIGSLSKSTLDAAHPVVDSVKRYVAPDGLEQFGWHLFHLWLERGALAKDKWAMLTVGLFGTDATALKLAPFIRKWPGESQHGRAILGLDCLRAIGTDTALMQINNIAQKAQFRALKQAAQRALQAIARERKMSPAELADRIVPDCGLDEKGQRIFDFGTRQFRLALDTELKPRLRDGDGRLKADLPKIGVHDDQSRALQAIKDWKLVRKQVQEVARGQAIRLEQAMISGRHWSLADFETVLVNHPLMSHLAQRLIWATYDSEGNLLSTIRVTAEKDYANEHDVQVSIQNSAKIGIVHPRELSEALIRAWGEIFGDYEIIPPFPQLGREFYALEPDEIDAAAITRFADIKVPAMALVGTLQKLGWTRGTPEDAGIYHEHTKLFARGDVVAVVQYDGVPVGTMQWDDQSVERCFFVEERRTRSYVYFSEQNIKLGQVDRIVISEVLRDLIQITSKGKA